VGAASTIKAILEIKNQKLIIESAGNLPPLEADPIRLERMLANLLSNASKFSPEGGKVILRTKILSSEILIEVQDEGEAISPDEQKRLFQPYHRVEQDRMTFSGLGLGMAISRQIIEAHRGKIWVTNPPEGGNTFSIQMPVKPAES
jgi:signal transduction histidine kinase